MAFAAKIGFSCIICMCLASGCNYWPLPGFSCNIKLVPGYSCNHLPILHFCCYHCPGLVLAHILQCLALRVITGMCKVFTVITGLCLPLFIITDMCQIYSYHNQNWL